MSAVHQLITDHLDIWTAADTEKKSGRGRASGNANSVYGIKKLRELILELAVRGRLVPQDPNDEPVSELLKKIVNERQSKGLPTKDLEDRLITPDSHFPIEWRQVKLGAIALIERGGSPRPIQDYITNDPDGLNWIKIGDTERGGKYIRETSEKIRREGLTKTRMVYPGDFLLTNSMSFGRPYISQIEGCIHDGWLRISPPTMLDKDYLYNLLSSPLIVEQFRKAAAGAVVLNLNADKVREVKVPIPPLAEQHRIAAKVDELMALCDQLEAQHNNAADAHEQLVSHLLSTLTQSKDATDFNANWQRIATHFDTLFTTESSIDALKQTLLQLAVMGKLVKQDPNDEPASELLSKHKIPYKPLMTKGWFESSLGNLGIIYGGATPSKAKPEYWTGDIPWISPKDMKRLYIGDAEDKVSEAAVSQTSLKLIPVGSVLMVVRGMILAHSFPVALTTKEVAINQDMKALVLPKEISEYVLLYLRAMKHAFVALVERSSHGTCKLLSDKLWATSILIPPIKEQRRIVAKVDELMALCDQLKSRISTVNQVRQQLADGLAEQAAA